MAAAGRSGIRVELHGTGAASVETGLPVLDHLLRSLAHYARCDLALEVEPDAAEAEVAEAGSAFGRALAAPLREDPARLVRKRLEGTHWKRRLPTVAMVSPTAIGEAYLRPVDY